MTFLQEFISAMKAGWHSGRGHKATRCGEFEKALQHYELALEYEERAENYGTGHNPVTLECFARTHARLGNYKEALIAAEESRELYNRLDPNTKLVADCASRAEHFIALLNAGNTDEIHKFLAIEDGHQSDRH